VPLFRYHEAVLERFPTTVGGLVRAEGVRNGPSPPALADAFRVEQEQALERLGSGSVGTLPSIAAWRRVFAAFGVEPTRYRNAAEALLRRLTKQGDVPSVSTLVDIGNLVSVRYRMPVAVLDLAGISGEITVRFADGSEEYTDLAGGTADHPPAGEVIFADDARTVHARRWCWRQSARSAARPDTRKILVAIEGHHDTAVDDVSAAVADLRQLLGEHCGEAEVEGALLTTDNASLRGG
jgi:DNA/RNA-binding domain of Phe-tRNA-synthetase-like protein